MQVGNILDSIQRMIASVHRILSSLMIRRIRQLSGEVTLSLMRLFWTVSNTHRYPFPIMTTLKIISLPRLVLHLHIVLVDSIIEYKMAM